jgi:hypothetical protein
MKWLWMLGGMVLGAIVLLVVISVAFSSMNVFDLFPIR